MTTALGILHLRGIFGMHEHRYWIFVFNNMASLVLAIYFGFMTEFWFGVFALGASVVYTLAIDMDEAWGKLIEWRKE